MIRSVAFKRCTKCGETKPISGFYRKTMPHRGLTISEAEILNITTSSAFYAECKECFKIRIADYKRRERESCQTKQSQPGGQRHLPGQSRLFY